MTDTGAVDREHMLKAICSEATWWLDGLERGDAADFVQRLLDAVVETLRRDPQIPGRTLQAWDLVLADLRREAEIELAQLIDGRVDRLDTVDQS